MSKNSTEIIPVSSLFPRGVITEQADATLIRGTCHPEEEAYVRNAAPVRRREFATGRLCARRALARFGITDFPLLVGTNKEPIWPKGIVGSISHAEGYCAIAVARRNQVESLGLDVEIAGGLGRNCWSRVFTQGELSWLDSLTSDSAKINATLIFSAKECLYKCQYTVSKRWLEFHNVRITVDLDEGEFEARFLVDAGSFFKSGTTIKGKYLFCRHYVLTAMWIPSVKN